MSDKITKSPQIRFAGFTDAWEQRRLGDFIEDFIEKTTIQNQYPVLTSSQQMGIVLQEDYFASRQVTTDENIGYFVLPKGYFTYRSRSDNGVFVFNRNDLIDKGIISYFYPVFRVKNADSDYFLRRLNFGIERPISIAAEGTGQRVLSLKKFKDIEAMFPSIQEQKKIGSLFTNLDQLITLHQRELEQLKEMKKNLLQKMFPKDGANVPEIRFAGFTDAWDQRRVGEFLTESKIKGSDGSIAKKLTVKLWRKGIVPKEEIYQGSSATQYYVRKSGQFMYGKLDFLNQAFGIVPPELDGYESTLDSPAFDFRDGINSRFFLEYISLKRFYKYQGNIANGSRKAKRIHAETFFEMPIPVPSYDEQQTIGLFFEQLDTTITLQQGELNSLKKLKKSMLQQMFI